MPTPRFSSQGRTYSVKGLLNGDFPPYGDNRLLRSTEHEDRNLRREDTEMTAAETSLQEDTELERVQAWRAAELERAGYSPAAAAELAARSDVDLHHANIIVLAVL